MIIYTDGACSGNPGPGGFGVVVLDDEEEVLMLHQEKSQNTTNNREELKAILWAMIKYGVPAAAGKVPPTVYSDSAYCVNTLTSWMFSWQKKGWIKSDNKTPENLDIIQPFYHLWTQGYRINLQKVHGHSGNKWNELADQLATGKIKV